MARPKWYPDAKTIRWVTAIAEREARRARSLASDDAKRRLYHGAIEQDARAGALEDLVAAIKRDEPEHASPACDHPDPCVDAC